MYSAIVIGASAGGLTALSQILALLPGTFPLPIAIVQHRMAGHSQLLEDLLNAKTDLTVLEPHPGQQLLPGFVYIAPGGYHLLIERNAQFSLSVDPPVCYSIPSIDVLFESAAQCYAQQLIGVVLTGANSDGSLGLRMIKNYGGLAIVQDPESAEVASMPNAAIKATNVDHILPLEKIADFLLKIVPSPI